MIQNCLVPVFTAADLAALPNTVAWLKTQKPERVLFLVNPSVGITGPELTLVHDKKIALLEAEKKAAAQADQFELAKTKKTELEGAIMERDAALREGWKSVPEAQRKAVYARVLAGLGTEPVMLREAYSADEQFTMLNSFRAQWPLDIRLDNFVLVWPQAVRKLDTAYIPPSAPAPLSQPSSENKTPPATPQRAQKVVPEWKQLPKNSRGYREGQLRQSQYMGVRSAAKKLGVYQDKMGVEGLIHLVLEKEFPVAQAGATVGA